MRKHLLIITVLLAAVTTVFAAYMNVQKTDKSVYSYDVDEVEQVTHTEGAEGKTSPDSVFIDDPIEIVEHDTTTVNDTVKVVHRDTTVRTKHDTTVVTKVDTFNVTKRDTTVKHNEVSITTRDTTVLEKHDTTKVTKVDTFTKVIRDTFNVTKRDTTTLTKHDTLNVTKRDTTIKIDTFVRRDTSIKRDTTIKIDTFVRRDTAILRDTFIKNVQFDTTVHDTTNLYGHKYVDLGLPSGTMWATCNVGATKPTGYGNYYRWGETTPYTGTEREDQYVVTDLGETLSADHDAATANWGSAWRMPTQDEESEMLDGCTWEWTDDYNGSGVAGGVGTSKTNGNVIFLPAAGRYEGTLFIQKGSTGYFWSSSYDSDHSDCAWGLNIHTSQFLMVYWGRRLAHSVRPVYALAEPATMHVDTFIQRDTFIKDSTFIQRDTFIKDSTFIKDTTVVKTIPGVDGVSVSGVSTSGQFYVDLGLSSGTKWATYNIGATKPYENGGYFAFGETEARTTFSTDSYSYTGQMSTLPESNDAATVNWGSAWRMPTKGEVDELVNGCTWQWVTDFNGTGVTGAIGTSKVNGNIIFFSASGGFASSLIWEGERFMLRTSTGYSSTSDLAWTLCKENGESVPRSGYYGTWVGFPIRAVMK